MEEYTVSTQLKLVENSDGKCCEERDDNKIAFMVSNSKPLKNIAKAATVIYDTVDVNSGNGYDSSTGIFTAASDGIYYFSWTTETTSKHWFVTHLAVNGKLISKNYATAKTINNNAAASSTAVARIKRGDKVCIKVDHGTGEYMIENRWSTFNGFKL